MGICPRSGTCSGSNQSFPSLLPSKARAHRTIVCTGPSTFQIPPPETRINDRNLEKAGYQTLVLYIFSPFLSFHFLVFIFLYLSIFFSPFLSFPFPSPPSLTHLHISPTLTLTLDPQLLILIHQKYSSVTTLTST